MLKLTEKVYLAAPFETPEQKDFNNRLAELVRSYNFPLFMPQEAIVKLASNPSEILLHAAGDSCNGSGSPVVDEAQLDALLLEVCMDVLSKANLVIAVLYGDEFDAHTAFEVGYALGRRINVVAVQNDPDPAEAEICDFTRGPVSRHCSRVVTVPMDDERLSDRLIPILNRYFVPH